MHLNMFSLLSSWINMYFITISEVYIPVNIYEIILSGKLRWKGGVGDNYSVKTFIESLFLLLQHLTAPVTIYFLCIG